MKLSKFKFDLPINLIASHPAENRDESRLMVLHRDTGDIEHKTFKDVWPQGKDRSEDRSILTA